MGYWDLWDSLTSLPLDGPSGDSIDSFLGGRVASLSPLEEKLRSGTRVAFLETLDSLLSYSDFPTPVRDHKRARGTVIRVRTSSGDITESNSFVFVRWDDGETRQIHRKHLRLLKESNKKASGYRMQVANLGDLTDFFKEANGSDLVHRATKDIWSFKQDSGGFVIERLFDDSGEPLKGV